MPRVTRHEMGENRAPKRKLQVAPLNHSQRRHCFAAPFWEGVPLSLGMFRL